VTLEVVEHMSVREVALWVAYLRRRDAAAAPAQGSEADFVRAMDRSRA